MCLRRLLVWAVALGAVIAVLYWARGQDLLTW